MVKFYCEKILRVLTRYPETTLICASNMRTFSNKIFNPQRKKRGQDQYHLRLPRATHQLNIRLNNTFAVYLMHTLPYVYMWLIRSGKRKFMCNNVCKTNRSIINYHSHFLQQITEKNGNVKA